MLSHLWYVNSLFRQSSFITMSSLEKRYDHKSRNLKTNKLGNFMRECLSPLPCLFPVRCVYWGHLLKGFSFLELKYVRKTYLLILRTALVAHMYIFCLSKIVSEFMDGNSTETFVLIFKLPNNVQLIAISK